MSEQESGVPGSDASSPYPELNQAESRQMNLKQYFDEKLHPKLSAALNACAIERPEDPVSFVGNFLLSHSDRSV